MASSQPLSENDGPDSNAAFHVHDVVEDASNSGKKDADENDSKENGTDEKGTDEHDTDESGSDESDSDDDDDSSTSSDEVKQRIPTAEDFDNLPFRVTTCGPPELHAGLHTDIMTCDFDPIASSWDPVWIIEPDVDIITNMIRPYARLCGLPNEDISVEFLARGAWNSVYTVSSADKSSQCVFRCALPAYPWFRTQLEVSTMEYVRTHTTIPVPKVFAFNSSMKNPLGLEWMLMEKIDGITYAEAKKANAIPFSADLELHRTVADWVHQLSQLTFDKLGCLYRRWDDPDPHAFVLGPVNDWGFLADMRLDLDVDRGPFTSKAHYTNAYIGLRIAEAGHPTVKERAEYFAAQRQRAAAPPPPPPPTTNAAFERSANYTLTPAALQKIPKYGVALQSLLAAADDGRASARFDGEEETNNNATYLYHADISTKNVMVDAATGKAVALLDWEGVCALPHGWTARYPALVDEYDYPDPQADMDAAAAAEGNMDEQSRKEAEEAWRGVLLRRAYEGRLRELGSPVLLREREDEDDLDAITRRARVIENYYAEWEFVDEMREKQLEKLLGVAEV
ncbi:Aminoglycoside phosphotransferase [Lasiodiplodia theobromae]|uniref:Aminoglycoside phosphotransferase n=1 Tax=Lasiodiplodia theobromae TaxID=45133 RepID=A0A8H7IR14_9PEZI|nr:Aminoglycoside phosphotransferase [Lasiodiplodia theobromae]